MWRPDRDRRCLGRVGSFEELETSDSGSAATIDVSGDGSNAEGRHPARARNQSVAAGASNEGLAIINQATRLAEYDQRNVIVGPGASVLTVTDCTGFAWRSA